MKGRHQAMRIVSLLPSATEIICELGLEQQLVGVTHECDFPAFVKDLPNVTRTLIPSHVSSAEIDEHVREQLKKSQALYHLDIPMLESLRPDLIVTQTLCDVCAVAEEEVQDAVCSLSGHPTVVNLEPQTLSQVFDTMLQVAEVVGLPQVGHESVARLTARVEAVVARSAVLEHRPRVVLMEWVEPPFSCGHWSPELVRLAGGIEGLGREGQPSRTLHWDEITAWQPEVIVIACCGFNVDRTMQDIQRLPTVPAWRDLPAVRSGRVYVADGSQYFSRPGPRLVESLEMMAHALHPDRHPLPAGVPSAHCLADMTAVHHVSP